MHTIARPVVCVFLRAIWSFAFCTIACCANARTIEVPGDYKTIQAAIDAATDDDMILVASGKYEEKLVIKSKRITLASQFLTSKSPSDVERTILDGGKDGAKKGPPILTVERCTQGPARLIGFTIQGSHHAVVNEGGELEVLHNHFRKNGDAVSFEDGRGAIRSNVFEENSDDGIDLDGSSAAVIEYNQIRGNRDDGIEVRLHKHRGDKLDIVIRNNVIEANREDGLQLIDYEGLSDRSFRIERNLFVDNSMVGLGCMSDGNTKENYEGADLLEPVLVINNTFVDNPYALTGGDNMVLLNNVFVGSTKAAAKRVHGDSTAGVNLFWKNASDLDDCDLNAKSFLDADPKLDENRHPRTGSPCIDGGAATLRYNGKELTLPLESYHGAAPDLGAFETTE